MFADTLPLPFLGQADWRVGLCMHNFDSTPSYASPFHLKTVRKYSKFSPKSLHFKNVLLTVKRLHASERLVDLSMFAEVTWQKSCWVRGKIIHIWGVSKQIKPACLLDDA